MPFEGIYRAALAVVAIVVGCAVGIGAYTFHYAKGASYLSNDPAACANCHVMQRHFDSWQKGTHHAVAVCNDCHAPEGFPQKYLAKSWNGFHHSAAFTLQNFKDNVSTTSFNRKIVEAACSRCHESISRDIPAHESGDQEVRCTRCHQGVGHP